MLLQEPEPSQIEDEISNVQSVDNLDTEKKVDDKPKTAVAVVYATVVLANSIYDQVTKSQIDSLSKIIDSKDHLQRNILDFKFSNISTWEMGNRKFKRQIQVVLEVNTLHVWENARSYLWRHLWASSWSLQDGTEISLVRIHQKYIFHSSFFRGFLGDLQFHTKTK
jgi:hypothetical protein